MSVVNQKDYLRKYLKIGKGSGKKKKKLERTPFNKGLKIIDDDIDTTLSQEIQDDLDAANEDAPQIVAVIDERPPSLRVNEQTKNVLWQPIGEASTSLPFKSFKMASIKLNVNKEQIFEKRRDKYASTKSFLKDIPGPSNVKSENDFSPPRNTSDYSYSSPRGKDRDLSSSRKKKEEDYLPRKGRHDDRSKNGNSPPRKSKMSDQSPSRKRNESDQTPPRKQRDDRSSYIKEEVDDKSPPRRNRTDDQYLAKMKKYEDLTPPRKNRYKDDDQSQPSKSKNIDLSPSRKRRGTDNKSPPRSKSPPRKSRAKDDQSPPRKSRLNDDKSPPRKSRAKDDQSPPRKSKPYKDQSPPRKKRVKDDQSPPGKSKDYDDQSPPRKSRAKPDQSPPRKRLHGDQSPPRKSKVRDDQSPPRKSRLTDDQSPPRKTRFKDDRSPLRNKDKDGSPARKSKKSRWGDSESNTPPGRNQMPEVTMSGKKSGLQRADNIAEYMSTLQKQEEQMFRTMSSDLSGANAATVVRKRKQQEEAPDPEKERRERELKEKYSLWGKGMKQVEKERERMADQSKEMNKPLARYADDEDLEKFLKEQEREGDPMLAYITRKKKKTAKEQGVSEKPMYMGDFMPNRFGIPPGYRWDGVDRSNGYEKKWIQVQNSKRAMQDEALQWSQEDM